MYITVKLCHLILFTCISSSIIHREHDYDERNFHRHVRDAIVSERLTSSPRVTSIFAFCGNSGYYDFAGGGSLADRLEKHWEALDDADNKEETGKHDSKDVRLLDQRTKLSLAHDMAAALTDLHDADGMKDANGDIISASMVHADITTDQFIIIDGNWKLNDFNRCRFMRRQRKTGPETGDGDGKPCGFQVGNNPGKGRSPEEYKYEEETEKVDVYSLGNVFYTILTDEIPFDDVGSRQTVKDIKNGIRANIPPALLTSEDLVDIALRTVVDQAWQQEPQDRPRARALTDYLAKELEKIDNKD